MLDAEPVSDVWVLDAEFWQHATTDAPAMAGHGLVTSADGRAWALGGIGADDWLRPLDVLTTFRVLRIHARLEVVVEHVNVPGPVPDSCFGQAFVAIEGGGSILSVGGACLGDPLNPAPGQLWEYRIDANRWHRLADLPVAISDHTAVEARDRIWVFGGSTAGGLSNEVFFYDLLVGGWGVVPTSGQRPDRRRNHSAVAVGKTMVVFGGIREPFFPETVDDAWQLDFDTLVWSEKAPMPVGLAGVSADAIPRQMNVSPTIKVLIYGGVVDAWSFPPDLSDRTLVYTSDSRVRRGRAREVFPTAAAD